MQGPKTEVKPAGDVMKLENLAIGAIDWSAIPVVVQSGATGTAAARTCSCGDVRLRLVAYSRGYKADHWCAKDHILHVLAGGLVIEHQDDTRTALSSGASWHAPDDAGPPHRVLCENGATVFIVD